MVGEFRSKSLLAFLENFVVVDYGTSNNYVVYPSQNFPTNPLY